MTAADTCCREVYPRGDRWSAFHGRPCGKPARVERDGKFYCGIHDPERPALNAVRERATAAFNARVAKSRLEGAASDLLHVVEVFLHMDEMNELDAPYDDGSYEELIASAKAAVAKAKGTPA